jgi:hypothetical protein
MTAEISINVTFVDADTNQVMGEMACEASRLPETFEKLETTLHLEMPTGSSSTPSR